MSEPKASEPMGTARSVTGIPSPHARGRAEREVGDAERGVQRRLGRLGEPEHRGPVVDAGGVGVHPLDAPVEDHAGGVGKLVLV